MENQQPTKNQFLEKCDTLLLRYKGLHTLPSFEAPKLKNIFIEGNSIHNIDSIAENDYPLLTQYLVHKNSKLSRIPLIEAPNLQRLKIKDNKKSKLLINSHFLRNYSNLKEVEISGITFDEPVETKSVDKKQDSIKEQTKNQEIPGDEQNKKHQLQKFINFKKYPTYLKNNGIQQSNQKSEQNYSLKIEFTKNIIKTLPCFSFTEIKEFHCKSNSIESLQHFSQEEYPCLEIIDLSSNLIKIVPKLLIVSVKKINFSNNKIESIEHFSEGEYPNLQAIDLSNNSIKILPQIKAPSLNSIALAINQIQEADQFFSYPYKFRNFELSGQRLQSIKEINFPELEELNLASNKLKEIPILRTPKLRILKIKGNSIVHTQALENNQLKLEKLEMQGNDFSFLPMLDTTNLECLNISNNDFKNFEKFAELNFPKLLTLQMSRVFFYGQFKCYIPKLNMPMIQVLNFSDSKTSIDERFFESPFESLRQIKLGKCKDLAKLPKFKAPKLELLQLEQTQINDISEFVGGFFYNNLKNLILPKNMILMVGLSKSYQQIILHNRTRQPIIPLPLSDNTRFFKSKPEEKLRQLMIDMSLVGNTQFIAFLNMTEMRDISFKNCYFETGLIKNLSKINMKSFPNLKRISIKENEKVNLLSFDDSMQWDKMIFVERDSLWRRSYCPNKPINWKIENVQISEGWRKNQLSLKFCQFQERLTGKIHHNKLTEAIKKRIQKLKKNRWHQNQYEGDENDFYRFERFAIRRENFEWHSPQMIRRAPPRIRNGFEFTYRLRVRQFTQNFFSNLRCRLAGKYIGQERYWRFIDFDQCGNAPYFHVRTIDGGYAQFGISLRMMKVSSMGVHHFFEKSDGWRTQQSPESCIDCLIEVDRLVREIYEIERKPCPLSDRNQIIEQLKSMANSSSGEIQINMKGKDR